MIHKKIGRRKFIEASTLSMLGYSMMIAVPPEASAATKAAISKKSKEIESVLQGKSYDDSCEPNMKKVELECDVLVCGAGMAGISAAIAAARNGAKVILINDRSRMGGNASSEIKMHPLGINEGRFGFRESGIIEELLLENAANNPQVSWDAWDVMLYDKCVSEPNITLILDTAVYMAEKSSNRIKCAYARCDKSLTIYKIKAKIYMDCTGDSRLAMESGAELMWGRDGAEKYGEDEVVDRYPIGGLLCSSIMYTTKDMGRPMPFKAPSWALKVTPEMLKYRNPRSVGLAYGYWFVSHGGLADTIRDNEIIRFELLSIVMGLWDYIKNSGKFPEAKNLALDSIGMIPGKRDSYRIMGRKLFSQHDIRGKWRDHPDQVGTVGWTLEDQPSSGFYAFDERPAMHVKIETTPFNIPLSILISKDVDNLMMAGRNMSCTHLAFSCTRVMKTGSVAGQAAGTAAAIAVREGKDPKDIAGDRALIGKLQQTLLKDGQIIMGVKNEDPLDFARKAKVRASTSDKGTSPENILSGAVFDWKWKNDNRWLAPISGKPWIELSWDAPQKLSQIIMNFDSGCKHLTMTTEQTRAARVTYAPQPETLADFNIVGILPDGTEKVLLEERGNYQKRRVYSIPTTEIRALRVDCLKTQGDPFARIFEVRCYS